MDIWCPTELCQPGIDKLLLRNGADDATIEFIRPRFSHSLTVEPAGLFLYETKPLIGSLEFKRWTEGMNVRLPLPVFIRSKRFSNVIVVDATADLNKSRTNLAYIQADVFIIDALDRSFGHVALRKIRAHWNAMESVGDFISLRPIP